MDSHSSTPAVDLASMLEQNQKLLLESKNLENLKLAESNFKTALSLLQKLGNNNSPHLLALKLTAVVSCAQSIYLQIPSLSDVNKIARWLEIESLFESHRQQCQKAEEVLSLYQHVNNFAYDEKLNVPVGPEIIQRKTNFIIHFTQNNFSSSQQIFSKVVFCSSNALQAFNQNMHFLSYETTARQALSQLSPESLEKEQIKKARLCLQKIKQEQQYFTDHLNQHLKEAEKYLAIQDFSTIIQVAKMICDLIQQWQERFSSKVEFISYYQRAFFLQLEGNLKSLPAKLHHVFFMKMFSSAYQQIDQTIKYAPNENFNEVASEFYSGISKILLKHFSKDPLTLQFFLTTLNNQIQTFHNEKPSEAFTQSGQIAFIVLCRLKENLEKQLKTAAAHASSAEAKKPSNKPNSEQNNAPSVTAPKHRKPHKRKTAGESRSEPTEAFEPALPNLNRPVTKLKPKPSFTPIANEKFTYYGEMFHTPHSSTLLAFSPLSSKNEKRNQKQNSVRPQLTSEFDFPALPSKKGAGQLNSTVQIMYGKLTSAAQTTPTTSTPAKLDNRSNQQPITLSQTPSLQSQPMSVTQKTTAPKQGPSNPETSSLANAVSQSNKQPNIGSKSTLKSQTVFKSKLNPAAPPFTPPQHLLTNSISP